MRQRAFWAVLVFAGILAVAGTVQADMISRTYDFSDAESGLAARATFYLDLARPDLLGIELVNMSTSLPEWFDSADQILTGVSFDLRGPQIMTGQAFIGEGGRSINFSRVSHPLGPWANVSGEWGYGNDGTTGMLPNLVSSMTAHTTPFPGANLDGPVNLNGPQGGLVPQTPLLSLGGQGAIAGPVVMALQLDRGLENLAFLDRGSIVEFGSNAAYLNSSVPEPASLGLLSLLGLGVVCRRRK